MKKRLTSAMEGWEIELYETAQTNLHGHQNMLDYIASGGPVVDDDVGDITDDQRRKSEWYVAYYRADIERMEYGIANDNEPPLDEYVRELIAGQW